MASFVENVFKILLIVLTLLSLYMLLMCIVKNDYKYYKTFSSWQFPMLLALLIDVFVVEVN
jgi:hypothetical protein